MSLKDKLNREKRNAEAWTPEPGDLIEGTVVDLSSNETEYGEYPIVVIETEDGEEVAIHAYHAVLQRAIEKKRPVEGDLFGAKYLGKTSPKKGKNPYHDYNVEIERAGASPTSSASSATREPSEEEPF